MHEGLASRVQGGVGGHGRTIPVRAVAKRANGDSVTGASRCRRAGGGRFLAPARLFRIVLLYAVQSFPPIETVNCADSTLQAEFPDMPVGCAVHSLGPVHGGASLAVALGRHWSRSISRSTAGAWRRSLPLRRRSSCGEVTEYPGHETALGDPSFGYQAAEEEAAASPAEHRLSRVHSEGTRFTMVMRYERPGTGISPAELPQLVGRTATVDIQPDTVLNWDMVD